jgi:hypothetical protein
MDSTPTVSKSPVRILRRRRLYTDQRDDPISNRPPAQAALAPQALLPDTSPDDRIAGLSHVLRVEPNA